MTIAQIFVAYAVCWWLVLFMVLPHQADAAKQPQVGNAPSAPANPQIKKKCIWTTFLAILPTALIFLLAQNAKAAEESMYHASSKSCHKAVNATPSADLSTKAGAGVGDKQVAPADLNGGNQLYENDVHIPILIPSRNYINQSAHNVDLSQSFIGAGEVTVTKEGNSLLNGKPISNNDYDTGDCNETH